MNKLTNNDESSENEIENKNQIDIPIQDHDFIYLTTEQKDGKIAMNLFETKKRSKTNFFSILHYTIMPHTKPYQLQLNTKLNSVHGEDKEITKYISDIPASEKNKQ